MRMRIMDRQGLWEIQSREQAVPVPYKPGNALPTHPLTSLTHSPKHQVA